VAEVEEFFGESIQNSCWLDRELYVNPNLKECRCISARPVFPLVFNVKNSLERHVAANDKPFLRIQIKQCLQRPCV
jgi:hypothetical protein